MSTALQNTSGLLIDGENTVQIDAYLATLFLFKLVKKIDQKWGSEFVALL